MRMNYNSVRRDMKKLRALAEECEAAAATSAKYQNELSQYWEGDSADAYKEGLRTLKTKNQRLAQDIRRAAALIQSVADDMEEEDRRKAAEIARKKMAADSQGVKSLSDHAKTASGAAKELGTIATSIKAASGGSSAKTGSSTLANTVNDLVSRLFGKE